MHSLHLNMKLSKSVVGTFCFSVLERWMRSAFLASRSGLCMRCMCSRSLSFRWRETARRYEFAIRPREMQGTATQVPAPP